MKDYIQDFGSSNWDRKGNDGLHYDTAYFALEELKLQIELAENEFWKKKSRPFARWFHNFLVTMFNEFQVEYKFLTIVVHYIHNWNDADRVVGV